ncbi:hypothetical protein [Aeromonas phage AerS_266]|nr:hypothetical protein [Aeromonas phage AerS_266]
MRNPKNNPFVPTNVSFWLRSNTYVNGKYEYSTKPGEWGYCQLVEMPGSPFSTMIAQLAQDWDNRKYSEDMDPNPTEEIAIHAALAVNRLLKEKPELLDQISDNSLDKMSQLLTKIEVTKDTVIH